MSELVCLIEDSEQGNGTQAIENGKAARKEYDALIAALASKDETIRKLRKQLLITAIDYHESNRSFDGVFHAGEYSECKTPSCVESRKVLDESES